MEGYKFKVAHKRADHEKWSAGDKARRSRLIKILEEMLAELRRQAAA
jgi:hypothetical protein